MNTTKRLIAVAVGVALIALLMYRQKPTTTTQRSTEPLAGAAVFAQSKNTTIPPITTESVRATIPTERRGTVIEETGHTAESNDFVLAVMRHPELALSPSETKTLLALYVDSVRQRTAYEASISTTEEISADEKIIHIPKYAPAGARFETDLYRHFAEALGETRAAQLQEAIRSELYVRNFGFGEAEQTITAKLTTTAPTSVIYEFLHSASELHVSVKDASGNAHETTLNLKGMRSLAPISNLGTYTAFVKLLPVGS